MSVLGRLLPRKGSPDLVVEPMRRKHLSGVMPIEQASYPKPWSQRLFQSEIAQAARGDRTYLVAREGSEVLGYGGLMYAVDEGHVTNIAVSPAHQRRGLGTRLLAELSWAAIDRGCEGMTLEVRVSNLPAQALYERFGFESAGIRQRYYENTEDAIVMWCHGIAEPAHRDRLRALCPEVGR